MVEGGEPPRSASTQRHFAKVAQAAWRLDASPRYFIGGPSVVNRLSIDLERPRVLIALREPVEPDVVELHVQAEQGPPAPGHAVRGVRVGLPAGPRRSGGARGVERTFRTLATGVYADYLVDWFDVLGDRVRVVFFDDIREDPLGVVTAICTRLRPGPDAGAGVRPGWPERHGPAAEARCSRPSRSEANVAAAPGGQRRLAVAPLPPAVLPAAQHRAFWTNAQGRRTWSS